MGASRGSLPPGRALGHALRRRLQACPLCEGRDWHILTRKVAAALGEPDERIEAAVNGDGAPAAAADDIDLLTAICGRCGYTVLIHYKTLMGGGWTGP